MCPTITEDTIRYSIYYYYSNHPCSSFQGLLNKTELFETEIKHKKKNRVPLNIISSVYFLTITIWNQQKWVLVSLSFTVFLSVSRQTSLSSLGVGFTSTLFHWNRQKHTTRSVLGRLLRVVMILRKLVPWQTFLPLFGVITSFLFPSMSL